MREVINRNDGHVVQLERIDITEIKKRYGICNFFVKCIDFTPDNQYNISCLSEDLQSKKIVEVG